MYKVPINWKPREYQTPGWTHLENADGGGRCVWVWHRRAGKDLTAINYIATQILERPALYWHVLPTYNQGRKIVWDGMTKTGRRFVDHLPMALSESENSTDMKITFKNKAIYQVVGGDNPDRLVGANPAGIVFSEFPLMNPRCWTLLRPILLENGGWAIFTYTPRGRNHGYKLFEMAQRNPKWFAQILTVNETNIVTQEQIQEERDSGMDEADINQEYFCSFDSPLKGAYYAEQMNRAKAENRIGDHPADPYLPVHTAWDIGVNDQTIIIFFQSHEDSIKIIDCYANSGEGLAHYVKVLKDKPYFYDTHYAPHDMRVRDFSTGKSRYETALSMGIRFRILPKDPIEDGIEAVRGVMPRTYWNYNESTEPLVWAMSEYRKQWDEKLQTYQSKPIHDWSSDYADAMRTLCMGHKNTARRSKANMPQYAIDESDM